jgi:hypothetical protein
MEGQSCGLQQGRGCRLRLPAGEQLIGVAELRGIRLHYIPRHVAQNDGTLREATKQIGSRPRRSKSGKNVFRQSICSCTLTGMLQR